MRWIVATANAYTLDPAAGGDEFMGFKRAVFAAGARSALVSLWPVDDNATEMLMTGFHEAWKQGSRAKAAQASQVRMLKEPKWAHPYFWAPFTLVGNAG